MAKNEEKVANSADQNRPSLPDEPNRLSTNGAKTPGGGSVNPFSEGRIGTTGGTGGVNPSGPTTGTEGWGLGKKEGGTIGSERDSLPIDERTFRCADAGNADCRWETSAQTEDDLMVQIERHGREAHGITDFDGDRHRKILDVVRERRTA